MSYAVICEICRALEGTVTQKALNGLPNGVICCEPCREAVRLRQVGVVRRGDGSLDVTDGRWAATAANEREESGA